MTPLLGPVVSNSGQSLVAIIPSKQLAPRSLQVACPSKPFTKWSAQDHADSYHFMQRIAQVWAHSKFTTQYLAYGKVDSNPFSWEIVPYQKCRTCLGRIIQQLQVLWRTVFGGIELSTKQKQDQLLGYQSLLKQSPEAVIPSVLSNTGGDSFCKSDTIERQWVITGKKVNALFNYAPIGFGGERLHFLIVPKEHRERFNDVTIEEYCESLALTKKLIEHFTEARKTVKGAYLLNKTGVDAGQTVKHWHLHVIFTTNAAQDFWGKLSVMKNILFGSSPMKNDALAKKVKELREELAHL